MKALASIVLIVLAIGCAVVIGAYIATIRTPDAGMAVLGIQVMLLAVSGITIAAGAIAGLVWKGESMKPAVAALMIGAVGFATLALSYALT